MNPTHQSLLRFSVTITLCGAPTLARAMDCYEVTSWTNAGMWAGEIANLSPVSCTSTPAGHSWLEIDPLFEIYLLISHLDSHASSPTLFEPTAYVTHYNGGVPVVMTDVFLGCPGGCDNTLPMFVEPPEPCGPVSQWYDPSDPPTPWHDSQNCYVHWFPEDASPFIYNNNWYLEPEPGTDCGIGSFDELNCYIQEIPPGGFISNDSFFSIKMGGSCPPGTTPFGGFFCHWFDAPDRTSAFTWDGNWYTTPLPECPMGSDDGANCYVGTPPASTTAFHWGQAFYYAL